MSKAAGNNQQDEENESNNRAEAYQAAWTCVEEKRPANHHHHEHGPWNHGSKCLSCEIARLLSHAQRLLSSRRCLAGNPGA
jgi:hypothetical protein